MDVYCLPEHISRAGIKTKDRKTHSPVHMDEKMVSSWLKALNRMDDSAIERYGKLLSAEEWTQLFHGWQNHYQYKKVRDLMLQELPDNEKFQQVLSGFGIRETSDLKKILEPEFEKNFRNMAEGYDSEDQLCDVLKAAGIGEKTALFQDLRSRLYTVCNTAVYRKTNDRKLCEIYSNCTMEEKTAFCSNVIEQCSITMLENYQGLFRRIRKTTTEMSEEEREILFSDDGTQKGYCMWSNRMELIRYMGDHEDRCKFWKHYVTDQDVGIAGCSNSFYITVGESVFVDMAEDTHGYLYGKDYFFSEVIHRMKRMLPYEFSRYQKGIYEIYRKQQGIVELKYGFGWQRRFRKVLDQNK